VVVRGSSILMWELLEKVIGWKWFLIGIIQYLSTRIKLTKIEIGF
jgi:hypothetical protein